MLFPDTTHILSAGAGVKIRVKDSVKALEPQGLEGDGLTHILTSFADNGELAYLRQHCRRLTEDLEREREHNRAQAGRLADLAWQLAELTRNGQVLLGAERARGLSGLWRGLFGGRKKGTAKQK
jgi:hypothetical protein